MDVFTDLPDDPLPDVPKPAAAESSASGFFVPSPTAAIPPIPASPPVRKKVRQKRSSYKEEFSNPWRIHTLRDLWQFFHLWVTALIGLEVYVSMRLARLGTRLVNPDIDWKWGTLVAFGLLMLLNFAVWMRFRHRDFRQFYVPLFGVTFSCILLWGISELSAWMLR